MKRTSILLLIIVCVFIKGQAQSHWLTANIQSPIHIEIPGTKYLIIKPDTTFFVALDYAGLTSKQMDAAIIISNFSLPFAKVLPFYSTGIPPKGGKLLIERDLKFNDYEAKLFKIEFSFKTPLEEIYNPEEKGIHKVFWFLIYGGEDNCFVLYASYPVSKDIELSEKIEKSLFSLIYLKDKVVDPLSGLLYSVELDNTPLKFASILRHSGVMFNIDGKFPSQAEDITNYSIILNNFGVEDHKKREVAIKIVEAAYKKNVEIQDVNPVIIDGLEGFEVIGYERNEDNELILNYAVTLFDTERYFVITGESKLDHLEMFRLISKTFKRKL